MTMSEPLADGPPKGPCRTLWASSLRVFDLSLGEMLWSRRTVFLALIVGGPVVHRHRAADRGLLCTCRR